MKRLPYLLVATGLPFLVISCACVLTGTPLWYTRSWWLLIAVPLMAGVAGLGMGMASLRKRGLGFGATMGELNEAIEVETRAKTPENG
jgi:hypothetical protein